MENYIMLNGKRIPLTVAQVEAMLGREPVEIQKADPFERNRGQVVYYIDYDGEVKDDTDDFHEIDDETYDIANYCTDREMMEQRALHETLNRLLWRYSEQHGGDSEWDGENLHYYICTKESKNLYVDFTGNYRAFGAVYFKDKNAANLALEEIVKPFLAEHPEFVW